MSEWQLLADWDRNNNFTDEYDDITEDVDDKIVWNLGCRPYQLVADESTLEVTVGNRDKKYSPENASSPLFGKLVPNIPVRLMYGDTIMWTGVTRTVKPAPFVYGKKTAVIKCVGIKDQLSKLELFINLYQNVTADEVIEDIVLSSASPPGLAGVWRLGLPGFSELGVTTFLGSLSMLADLDEGVQTFGYVGDNIQAEAQFVSAYQIIKDLVEAERGRFFMDRRGRAVFWNQDHLADDTTIEETFDNSADGLDYSTPTDELINYMEVMCYPRELSSDNSVIIWALSSPITIKPGDTAVLHVPYRKDDDKYVGAKNCKPLQGLIWHSRRGLHPSRWKPPPNGQPLL